MEICSCTMAALWQDPWMRDLNTGSTKMVHSPLWFIVSRDKTNQRCAKSFQSSNGFRCCDVRSYTARILLFPVKHPGNRISRALVFLYDCARRGHCLYFAPFVDLVAPSRFEKQQPDSIFKRGTNKFLIHFSLIRCVEEA